MDEFDFIDPSWEANYSFEGPKSLDTPLQSDSSWMSDLNKYSLFTDNENLGIMNTPSIFDTPQDWTGYLENLPGTNAWDIFSGPSIAKPGLFDKGGILGSDSSVWKGIGAGVDIASYLDQRGMTKDQLALNRDKFNAEKDMYNNYVGNLDEVIDFINQKHGNAQNILNRQPVGAAPQLKPFTMKTLASGGGLSAIADRMRGPEEEEMEEEDDMPPGGQDDLIPALVAEGEFFFDADTVSAIGDGSSEAGIARLEQFRENIRRQKRAAPIDEIPPKTRPLESYMKGKV